MANDIKIRGMDKLLRKLEDIRSLSAAKRGLRAGALHIKGAIAKYPSSTEANQPRAFNSVYSRSSRHPINTWYQRGFGSKWIRKSGTVGSRKSSESLGRKWTIDNRNDGLTQVIGNNAKYAPYVQSAEKQAKFHHARGWETDEEIVKKEGPRVLQFVKSEVDKALEKE